MRQFVPRFLVFSVLFGIVLTLAACGGGTPKANVVDSVRILTPTISLNRGDEFGIVAQALDANGHNVLAQFTFTSSNTNIVSVAPDATLCAGTWDPKFVDCTPATQFGIATITATASGRSATATVYVHEKVDNVQIDPIADCISMADTARLTAKAYSNDAGACQRINGSAPPCQIPASTLGNFVWNTNDSYVVTLDNSVDNSGTATAVNPGQTTVFASLSNNNSPAVKFTTCPVTALSITVKDSTAAPFSLDKSGTKTLVATAVDSKGKTLTAAPISWNSSQAFAMAIAASASSSVTATATASSPGTSGLVASCTPPGCNRKLSPVYSNLIVGSTNGTTPGDTLYVGSQDSTSLVPIDLANNNTVGTAITLPEKPNSLIVSRSGLKIALGSDVNAMLVDPTVNTVASLGIAGRMLGYSSNSALFAFAGATTNQVSIVETTKFSPLQSLSVTGDVNKLRIDFTPDAQYAFLTMATNKMDTWDANNTVQTVTLNSAANDVNFLANGWAAYLAGGNTNEITARVVCDPFNNAIDHQTANNPQIIRAIPDGSGILALDPPNLIELSPVTVTNAPVNPSTFTQCPPVLNSTRNSYVTGISNPTAMIVTPDSNRAFITDGSGSVYIYDLQAHTTKPVTLTGTVTATYQPDVTLDSRYAYVGANDGKVHKIDLIAGTDVGQIDPVLRKDDKTTVAMPTFVALRHK